jgi:putative transposase
VCRRHVKQRRTLTLKLAVMTCSRVILGGIELIHMMRKQQAKYAFNRQLSLAEQFERLAA